MRFALTPAQSRAGRALLEWTQADLARAAMVGLSTVRGFELGTRAPIPNNIKAMREALEQAGVEFIENGAVPATPGGVGARLRDVLPV
ncbi:helix-turn-helix transcriptional regulator [Ancylobacter sonchi]|nr:helix-turn-helix transcriptional regulator [Ancylobacter sonchi]